MGGCAEGLINLSEITQQVAAKPGCKCSQGLLTSSSVLSSPWLTTVLLISDHCKLTSCFLTKQHPVTFLCLTGPNQTPSGLSVKGSAAEFV